MVIYNKFCTWALLLSLFLFASCDIDGNENKDDYYFETAKVKEVWIWDRIDYRTEWEAESYTTEEEWRDNFFYVGGGSHYFVVPYAFIFYDNGYYDFFNNPSTWNQYLKDFDEDDGPTTTSQFWKIEESYFYTTWSRWKAKREDEFGKAYKIISNNSSTVVLKPIYGAINYGGLPDESYYDCWTVTLKKKKYND
ncbi:MAG: hypothetical protein IK076_03820, partial [Bacteroidales bacterium]|nr:hypothetical protein [Bacteroidales bacterium]